MDGNNRWSKKTNTDINKAYKKGADNLVKITNYLFKKYKIKYISSFALSAHNLRRSKNFLKIFINVFNSYIDDYSKKNHDFKVKFIGNLSFIKNSKTLEKIKEIEKINANSNYSLLIFINYSGQNDIHLASQKFRKKTSYDFKNHLSTENIPDPDMLLRTGGFQRLSDFMLYQLSFTDLFFTKILWPDLKLSDIDKFIIKFSKLERKFGT